MSQAGCNVRMAEDPTFTPLSCLNLSACPAVLCDLLPLAWVPHLPAVDSTCFLLPKRDA